ncbi:YchJ family protein [Tessaracoccus sp. ZS01]|uniref:YchJ family protein n=1 Tax=Tessaracoccus sp. ZS01 TaxID=1906324 RepID=UPI0009701819|nr:YchJ family metal-binding protein [Tessaracoccus sp. ZS01]MCG6567012.1 hypothetical protein [Tessaracoccus sp. ZS01]OMG57422.1 hypothetical protein BJN44_05145 [Tessaracoccus sp. ZS01]
MSAPLPCPCDTGKVYPACCGRFHDGRPAPTAVALMRSRYSAFVFGLSDHLMETWHPTTRPPSISLDDGTQWSGLVIERTERGNAWDDEGTVQFAATFLSPDGMGVLQERSRFTQVDGRWYYVDGTLG